MADSHGGGVVHPFSPPLPSFSPTPALVFLGHRAELAQLPGLAES